MPVLVASSKPLLDKIDFNLSPFIVIWEMTRSCALRCIHCRAEAVNERNPEELSTREAFALLDEIRRFGQPVVVLTGGDPMRRPDALDIVEYGSRLGLRMTMTPSATAEMTFDKVRELRDRGLARLAVSLDGPTPLVHDSFRQVDGSFDWTMEILSWAEAIHLPTQINTTITRHNLDHLDVLCELLLELPISLWSVFFLVPVGRGKLEDEVNARDYERVFEKMFELSQKAPFDIKSTEAPHYRRFVIQKKHLRGEKTDSLNGPGFFTRRWNTQGSDGVGRSAQGVNDGRGFAFISHTGEIFPSGFLPISAGNVQKDSLVSVYRDSALFKTIRNTALLKGKCGACEFKSVCGGSRSRAYAMYGDYLASDPFCAHIPERFHSKGAA